MANKYKYIYTLYIDNLCHWRWPVAPLFPVDLLKEHFVPALPTKYIYRTKMTKTNLCQYTRLLSVKISIKKWSSWVVIWGVAIVGGLFLYPRIQFRIHTRGRWILLWRQGLTIFTVWHNQFFTSLENKSTQIFYFVSQVFYRTKQKAKNVKLTVLLGHHCHCSYTMLSLKKNTGTCNV